MTIRYTDMDESENGVSDFVIRKRAPTVSELGSIFFITAVIAASISVVIAHKALLVLLLLFILGITAWYAMIEIQRNRDLVTATEFQNALFASAMGLNNKFSLILKRDGSIVYMDRAFQDMFPDFLKQPSRAIDVLLEFGQVSREESQKIVDAIANNVYDKAILEIRDSDNEFHRIIMTIEPILRPRGFTLLRGREYVERRAQSGDSAQPKVAPLMSRSNMTLFSHVMDTMNMGVYMTDPAGNVVYFNPTLEQWLGYKDGETATAPISLQDIVAHSDARTDTIIPTDFEGEAALRKKIGGSMKVFINQKIIRDEQGKTMGCTALVHSIRDASAEVKKKLW